MLGSSVPARVAFSISYPGYVTNVDAAIQTLGGWDAVADAHANRIDNALVVNCQPGDALRHPLAGARQRCNSVLLRLERKGAGNAAQDVAATVEAVIPTQYSFTGLADFQYAATAAPSGGGEAGVGPYGPESEPLLLVPPAFSQRDQPMDYAFRDFRASDGRQDDGAAAPGGLLAPGLQLPSHMVTMDAPSVPAEVESPTDQGATADAGTHFLTEALASRPAWLLPLLQEQAVPTPGVAAPALAAALPRLCYQFQNGPWRGLWIRRGYDPRRASAGEERRLARGYQVIEVKVPHAKYAVVQYSGHMLAGALLSARTTPAGDPPAGAATSEQPRVLEGPSPLRALLTRLRVRPGSSSVLVQLCDLANDPAVASLLQSPFPKGAACRARSGFLTQKQQADIVTALAVEDRAQTPPLPPS